VDFKSYIAAARADLDNRAPSRSLNLVKSRKKPEEGQVWPVGPGLSANAMRHNFAIWVLEKAGMSRRRFRLYYCVRCKWAFQVDNRSGSVTPLDEKGDPLRAFEASERLATFGVGPCPVLSRLTEGARLTQVVTRQEAFLARLATMFHNAGRMWKRPNRTRNHLHHSAPAGRQKESISRMKA
jgi:hypothetical protein